MIIKLKSTDCIAHSIDWVLLIMWTTKVCQSIEWHAFCLSTDCTNQLKEWNI